MISRQPSTTPGRATSEAASATARPQAPRSDAEGAAPRTKRPDGRAENERLLPEWLAAERDAVIRHNYRARVWRRLLAGLAIFWIATLATLATLANWS